MDRARLKATTCIPRGSCRKSEGFVQENTDPADPAIELRDISFSYTKKSFIESLNIPAEAGKVTSIVGPNGCGKSTILKLMDGLVVPQQGEVLIKGQDSLSMANKNRAQQVALLPQGGRPPSMSVEKLVMCGRYPHQKYGQQMHGEDVRQVEKAMALTGIERFRHHDVRFLSGGERQRAFIAMTLAQDTDIIVLDEPTTYLDIKACHEIMQLVCSLNEEHGKTIVMVIHDIDLALRYSDSMVVMREGSCLQTGSVTEVLDSGALEKAFEMEIELFASRGRTAYGLFPA